MPKASDDPLIQKVKKGILFATQNSPDDFFRRVVGQAIEEVIDGARTGRFSISELAQTEKTYIGTKVEIIARAGLKMPWGDKLDLKIAGQEVDVKNTVRDTWMIPSEANNEICLLIKSDEEKQEFSVGLLRMTPDNLTVGLNKDKKLSVSAAGRSNIDWLVHNANFPKGFLATLTNGEKKSILAKRRGQARVTELLRLTAGRIVPRIAIETLAQQKDPMKRVRSNGGAQDELLGEGIVVLVGDWLEQRKMAVANGLPEPKGGEVVCIRTTPAKAKAIFEQLA